MENKYTYKITHTPCKLGIISTHIQADSAVEAIRKFATRRYSKANNLELVDMEVVPSMTELDERFMDWQMANGKLSTMGD